jgi:CBS domain-containing protein
MEEVVEITARVAIILDHKGRAVYSVSPYATVFEAIQELADRNVGALVVLQQEHLLGIFSERDYTRNVALQGRSSKETRVMDVMSDALVTVTTETPVTECMRLMTDRRVRHLPVLDDERVVGIISIGDLVNFIINTQRETIEHLHSYITGTYPR